MALLLIGTLDTKGEELGFARDLLAAAGRATVVVDVGSMGPPRVAPDVPREAVLARAGTTWDEVRARGDRGEAVAAMARGAAILARELFGAGEVDGAFALGGSAGTVIGSSAMRALPFGVPKVLVSTLASGQTRPFLGGSDITLVPSLADLAGLNRLTRTTLANAAHALLGMVAGRPGPGSPETARPITVAATMFGVTTPCVDRARATLARLSPRPVETLVFHATGTGGEAMEALIRLGEVDAVLDLTTTEMADELVGGILSAGPDRLKAAVRRGLPQVVSVGALDMVNFGPRATVPAQFAGRTFHQHNPAVTLMRTTPGEVVGVADRMARILRKAKAPTVVLLPLGGVSALDVPGTEWHDPDAHEALVVALRSWVIGNPLVRVVERPEHINDPAFADEAARLLLSLIGSDIDTEPHPGSEPTEATP